MRCSAVDIEGKRCRGVSRGMYDYFGDYEIYGTNDSPETTWMRIPLCKKHSPDKSKKEGAE